MTRTELIKTEHYLQYATRMITTRIHKLNEINADLSEIMLYQDDINEIEKLLKTIQNELKEK